MNLARCPPIVYFDLFRDCILSVITTKTLALGKRMLSGCDFVYDTMSGRALALPFNPSNAHERGRNYMLFRVSGAIGEVMALVEQRLAGIVVSGFWWQNFHKQART